MFLTLGFLLFLAAPFALLIGSITGTVTAVSRGEAPRPLAIDVEQQPRPELVAA